MPRGRPPTARGIASVRDLTSADIARLQAGERGRVPVVTRFRDSHHKVARLIASGLRYEDVARICGYSIARIYTLTADPSFQELIETKRSDVDRAHHQSIIEEYRELVTDNMMLAERRTNDILQDDEREFSLRELQLVSRDGADRVGLGKRTVNFNINADFASAMEKAARRSNQVIEGTAVVVAPQQAPQRIERPPPAVVPSRILRRA